MGGQKNLILYLGDHNDSFLHLKKILENKTFSNFQLDSVQNLMEAIEASKKKNYDLFLIDKKVNVSLGKDFLNYLDGKQKSKSPIVFVESNKNDPDWVELFQSPANYTINLNVDKDMIMKTLYSALDHKKVSVFYDRIEKKFETLADISQIGIIEIDVEGHYCYQNKKWIEISYNEEVSDIFYDTIHFDDRRQIEHRLRLAFEKEENLKVEFRVLTSNDIVRWIQAQFAPFKDNEQKTTLIGILTDITALKTAEAKLAHEANHDTLTGFPNRTLFIDRLDHAIKRMKRFQKPFAVLFIDLDRFKWVNDSLGHKLGDELLKIIAQKLKASVRENDTVARMGGDEFALLLEDLSPEQQVQQASMIAIRFLSRLSEPILLSNHEIFTSASIGIVLAHSRYEHPEDILRDADLAMYRAKETGKSCYQFFDEGMHAEAVQTLTLSSDLRHALVRGNEFLLYYQPIVNLVKQSLIGFEALIRWQHPERGLLMPSQFLKLAEEMGLMNEIGGWVLERAFSDFKKWLKNHNSDHYISINLFAGQIVQHRLTETIRKLLTNYQLNPYQVQLEITESSIMKNPNAAEKVMKKIREMGIGIAIDDFGTGYSSLSYLQKFPITCIKIDASFVHNVQSNTQNLEIIRMILALGETLKAHVVAEGIETKEDWTELIQLGCHYGQGYLFGRPHSNLESFNNLLNNDYILKLVTNA